MKKPILMNVNSLTLMLFAVFIISIQNVYAQSWNITGNAGTSGSTNFIGTTDNVPFKIRTNNAVRLTVSNNGKIGIGTSSPVFKLDIKSGSINTDSLYRISGVQVLKRDASDKIQVGDSTANISIGTSVADRKLKVLSGTTPAFQGVIHCEYTGGPADVYGIYSKSAPADALGYGGYFEGGYMGARGMVTATGNNFYYGLYGACSGSTTSGTKRGISGQASGSGTANYGVFGDAIGATTTNYGIYGQASGGTTNWAGYFGDGNVYVQNKVGIGTQSPQAKMQITYNSTNTDPQLVLYENANDYSRLNFGNTNTTNYWSVAGYNTVANTTARLNFYNSVSGDVMSLTGDGNVCIGVTTPATGYKLSVFGKIICEEMKVQMHANWPDYVFGKNYKLKPLREIEQYTNLNGHLPGIPSASEVENSGGVEVGQMQTLLLEKVEELTLHVIRQEKEIEFLKSKLNDVSEKN